MTRASIQSLLLPVVLCAMGLSGCLTVDRDDGPILVIELLWDARPNAESFLGSTCTDAGVERMDWVLYDADGEEVAANVEPCADFIDVLEAKPGVYELEVTGFDEDDDALWSVTCTDLRLLRFDVAFECDVHSPEPLEP